MKQYKNIGSNDVLGYSPGEEFDAEIPEAQEARLIGRGSIEVVGESSAVSDADNGETDTNPDPVGDVPEGEDNAGYAGEGSGF